jgi:hypothetical protein
VLNTPIPGVGKSYQELSSALGLSLDVQTTTPSGSVHVIVTPRFSGNPGAGKISGRLRLPKQACIYISNRITGVFPVGFNNVNTDLEGNVGNACSTALSGGSFKISNYLGGNPTGVPGGGATSLPNWISAGDVTVTGTLTSTAAGASPLPPLESAGYYECQFEVSGLPNAGIVELAPDDNLLNRLTGYYSSRSRYFESSAPPQTLVLDADWKLVSTDGQVTRLPAARRGDSQPLASPALSDFARDG